MSLPFPAALPLLVPERLFAPWTTVGVVLLPFLVVLHLLFPYGRSPLLGVPPSPFLIHPHLSAFRPKLGFLPLPWPLKGRRYLAQIATRYLGEPTFGQVESESD